MGATDRTRTDRCTPEGPWLRLQAVFRERGGAEPRHKPMSAPGGWPRPPRRRANASCSISLHVPAPPHDQDRHHIFDPGAGLCRVGGPTIAAHRAPQMVTLTLSGMNRRTKELFERYTPKEVVMLCPSCIYFYDEVQKLELPFRLATPRSPGRSPGDCAFSGGARAGWRCTATASARPRREARPAPSPPAVPDHVVDLPPDERFGRSCKPRAHAKPGPEGCARGLREPTCAGAGRTRSPACITAASASSAPSRPSAHHHRALPDVFARASHRVRGHLQEVRLWPTRPHLRGLHPCQSQRRGPRPRARPHAAHLVPVAPFAPDPPRT